jgi:hypothetical protein
VSTDTVHNVHDLPWIQMPPVIGLLPPLVSPEERDGIVRERLIGYKDPQQEGQSRYTAANVPKETHTYFAAEREGRTREIRMDGDEDYDGPGRG